MKFSLKSAAGALSLIVGAASAEQLPPDIFWGDVVFVAKIIHLSIPAQPSMQGPPGAEMNKLIAQRIVLYCARAGHDAGRHACEMQEGAAYNRLIDGNEFPRATRGMVMACATVDSYLTVEQCLADLVADAR